MKGKQRTAEEEILRKKQHSSRIRQAKRTPKEFFNPHEYECWITGGHRIAS
jgi:hypothetical protein